MDWTSFEQYNIEWTDFGDTEEDALTVLHKISANLLSILTDQQANIIDNLIVDAQSSLRNRNRNKNKNPQSI